MSHLTISLLGAFHSELDGTPLTGFASNKGRALIAYLAVEADRPHRRESLAALLWPEFPEAAAFNNLRVALADLRDQLHDRKTDPPFLLIDRDTVQFNPQADCWVDVWEFEEQGIGGKEQGVGIRRPRSGIDSPQSSITNPQSTILNLQSAIALYRGPFLEGFSVPDSAPFEEWLVLHRERLNRLALRSLHTLADFYESCGEVEPALAYARQQVALEPWLEEAHRQIMRLLALGDQHSAALAHYEACKRILATELGIEPSVETTRLYETIRTGRFEDIRRGNLLPFPGEPPYKGLRFFDEPDAALFFGREVLTDRLVEHIHAMTVPVRASRHVVVVGASRPDGYRFQVDREGSPLPDDRDLSPRPHMLAVVGASGSGKSSLVRAGLVPALKREGYTVDVITPTAHPMEVLKGIGDRGEEGEEAGEREKERILVVDQFEELFTLCRSEEERAEFLDCLLTPSLTPPPSPPQMKGTFGEGGDPPLHRWFSDGEGRGGVIRGWGGVVLALRADFYSACAQYPRLREALCARQEYIGPMSASELRQAIEQPALLHGWEFEPGLVDLILRDIGASEDHPPEPGALPLLEHALLETWQRRSGRTLTLKGYADAGGVHGAIAKTAESVFTRLSPEQQALARRIFVRLTELGEGTQDTRRRAPLSELTPSGEEPSKMIALLQTLADARLITLGEGTAEVAHEALIREWPALRQWLSEDREGLRLHRHLTDSAEAWAELARDPGELYRGARLAQALEWAEAHPDDLNALESDYLQASQAQAQAEAVEREAQRQRELEAALRLARTQRQRSLVLSVGLTIAVILVGMALWLNYRANTNLKISEAQRLAAEANRLLIEGKSSVTAALLALRSLAMQYTPQGDEALSRASRLAYPLRILNTSTAMRGIAFNGDGSQLVTNSADNHVRLWDVASGQLLRTFYGETGVATWVDISADGRYVAALGSNVVVWDGSTGQQLITMDSRLVLTNTQGISITTAVGITISCFSIDISSDGMNLLVGHADGTVRIWEIATGKEVQRFPGHVGNPLAMVFSPDDRYVLTSDAGVDQGINHVRLWDVRTGELLRVFAQHRDTAEGLAFSPDGKTILTASIDQSACFWDVPSGKLIRCIQPGTPLAFNATFSPDGRYALAGGVDGIARLWEVSTGEEIHRYPQSDIIGGVAFSPDGKMVATASFDGTACIWVTESTVIQKEFLVPGAAINYLSFSPDGRSVLAGAGDGAARIWDVNTGQAIAKFSFGGNVWNTDYSADGQVIFADPAGPSMFTLDASTGITRSQMTLTQSYVFYADMAPDGKTAVVVDGLSNAYLFDAISGELLKQFPGTGYSQSLAFSPDGSRVAMGVSALGVGGKGQTWIFSYPGLEKLLALDYPTDTSFTDMEFSADGRSLLSAGALGNNDLILWDAVSGKKLQQFTGITSMQFGVALSIDGRYVAAAGVDAIARMWEVATGHEVRRFMGHTLALNGIDFSPDGKWVATSSNDGTLKLWLTDLGQLKTAICNVLPRDLTAEERAFYGITDSSPTCPKFAQSGNRTP